MKELKIEYQGGFRIASKFLTFKHGANFAILLDGLIYIYNQNLTKLVKTNEDTFSVKVSNGFLSRATGLGRDIVKRQMNNIEKIGLVTAIKKGQGNTRHYIIHIEDIDTYVKALKIEFNKWFKESLNYGKREISRSKEADKIKDEERKANLKSIIDNIKKDSVKDLNRSVQNQPTEPVKTNLPNNGLPTVVERTNETKQDRPIETTTEAKFNATNQFLNLIFSLEDGKGAYTILGKFNEKKVYQKEYEDFIHEFTEEKLEAEIEIFRNQISTSGLGSYKIVINENNDIYEEKIENDDALEETSVTEIMMHIYDEIDDLKRKFKRKHEKERKNSKNPASRDVSTSNWNKLEKTYHNLHPMKNQGKFYTSIKDKEDFYSLSEYRQEYVIESVSKMKEAATTASRPAIYIEEAMKDKLGEVYDPHARLSVAL